MEAGKKIAILLLALSLASMLFLSGCTSSKYIPCCVKSNMYQDDGNPFPDPMCIFQNGSAYGPLPCILPNDTKSVAFCSNGTATCASLNDSEEACNATWDCVWTPGIPPFPGKCSGGTGGLAYVPLPVCTDLVPKSCINDKCTAMMCGYASIRPAPPPASQDWDAETASSAFNNDPSALSTTMPGNDLQMPTIGLQKVTCDFNTMNNKLYNKVKASRGALWVNSFRFGVGSSFSDFEAAKNFFPATDHACAANPYATVDRFTVYLNSSGTYCKNQTTYYKCNKLPLYFKDNESCALYCGGGAPPYSCDLVTGGTPKAVCNQDGFAYENESTCKLKCSRIDDPNACANSTVKFPFLATDNTGIASYRMKYSSDYVVDTINNVGSSASCNAYGGPTGQYGFHDWMNGDFNLLYACNDYAGDPNGGWVDGPWFSSYSCYYAAGCSPSGPCPACPNGNYLGPTRSYFDNHAYSALDFDYSYYKKALLEQYTVPEQNGRLPFECESSSDCLSGSCDNTYYKRPMCVNVSSNLSMACDCSAEIFAESGGSQKQYPSCYLGSATDPKGALPIYSETDTFPDPYMPEMGATRAGQLLNGGPLFSADDSIHLWYDNRNNPTNKFRYFAFAGNWSVTNDPPLLFSSKCRVNYTSIKQLCIMKDRYWNENEHTVYETAQYVVRDPQPDGMCNYTVMGIQGSGGDPNNNFRTHYDPAVQHWQNGQGDDFIGHFGFPGPIAGYDSVPFYPKYYYVYDFNLDSTNMAEQVHAGQFGTCKLNGKFESNVLTPAAPPYLVMKNLGWCAGCSYATLAVQKVDWNASTNPGGIGSPRNLACYEYHGDFNYVPSPSKLPYGGPVEDMSGSSGSNSLYSGQIRGDYAIASPSTESVRRDSNPSAYQFDTNGNLALVSAEGDYVFSCNDLWHANGGWWKKDELPTPSAPYLKAKLTSYLQSNVMPILDEMGEKTMTKQFPCSVHLGGGMYWTCSQDAQTHYGTQAACEAKCVGTSDINQGYNPLAICNAYGGDGAVLHVIGNTSMLSSGYATAGVDYGSIMTSDWSSEILSYMGIPGSGAATFPTNAAGGKNAIIARAELLKDACKTSPLTGIEVMPYEDETSLIGNVTKGVTGKLHTFFFKPNQTGYDQRVARGLPDPYPDKVDLLLQDWYPMCSVPGGSPGEKEVYEIERREDFSRALLGNFSKPSLIWKFAFPTSSSCNKTFFLDYLFNSTQDMVDAGITGLIYSDWSMQDGLGYGPVSQTYDDTDTYPDWRGDVTHSLPGLTLKTGLTQSPPYERGGTPSQTTAVLDDRVGNTGKTSLFCALEKYSLRSIGFISLTYGQKLYAENQTCYCEPCTDYDQMTGACDAYQAPSPDLPQLVCNDGTKCTMPGGATNYNLYKCESRCMNYDACKLCNGSANLGYASFCRISEPGGATAGYSWNYSDITDNYWEFLTGLSPSEKCCLAGTDDGAAGTKYTYVGLSGSKQQSVFLQYPSRGEYDIDCGNAPDTSVLEYCNIRVPISQKEIACMRIDKPTVPIKIEQGGASTE